MELVHAPVAELKALLTQSFEEWAQDGRSCALSGGPAALLFLPALRAAGVDWSRITLFWADERALDIVDPESNYGLAERMLLKPLGRRAPRALRMPIDMPLDQAARKYDDALTTELHGGVLDLAILGVAEDGSVCALFPEHRALVQDDLRAVAIDDAPKHPRRRLTLTMRFLLQTRKIWLMAVGPRKLAVLHAALSKRQRLTPLDLVLQQAKDVTVFTDQVIRSAWPAA
ncbi:MAG TPA: 6-phosphogluconolactonase [Vicinamibacterales bacterium]|jgi:6-phosphogluconolactonase